MNINNPLRSNEGQLILAATAPHPHCRQLVS